MYKSSSHQITKDTLSQLLFTRCYCMRLDCWHCWTAAAHSVQVWSTEQ